jgi:threonine synthase
VILAGVAKGFADLVAAGLLPRLPRLLSVQPAGSAAIAHALATGSAAVERVDGAASVADSLVVAAPRNALLALRRVRESGGAGVTVSDQEILGAIPRLAGLTGVFAEPAAAAALAGLEAALDQRLVERDERVGAARHRHRPQDVAAAARAIEMPRPIPQASRRWRRS